MGLKIYELGPDMYKAVFEKYNIAAIEMTPEQARQRLELSIQFFYKSAEEFGMTMESLMGSFEENQLPMAFIADNGKYITIH